MRRPVAIALLVALVSAGVGDTILVHAREAIAVVAGTNGAES